jgi:hypothetical protein
MPIFTTYDPTTGEIRSVITAKKNDVELNTSHYVEGQWDKSLYRVVNGEPVEKSTEEVESAKVAAAEERMRISRDKLLQDSDWTQMPDAPLTEAQKTEWQTYRQQLRDLPANTEDPRNVTWPTKPSS